MLLKQLTLSSERVLRRKPYNYDNKDEILFKREFIKNLPNIFPILKKKMTLKSQLEILKNEY